VISKLTNQLNHNELDVKHKNLLTPTAIYLQSQVLKLTMLSIKESLQDQLDIYHKNTALVPTCCGAKYYSQSNSEDES